MMSLRARLGLALFLVLPVGPLTGCRLAPPEPDAWLAVGFRTPRATFQTFQTALRADLPDLEYRCLSQEMKSSEGLNQLAYRTFRGELFGENPWLKYAAEAEVIGESRVAPGRVRLVATVSKLWIEKSFAVELVREDYYELYEDGELLEDGFANFERNASSTTEGELNVFLPLPFESDPKRLSEVRLGREWKISGFVEVEVDDPDQPES